MDPVTVTPRCASPTHVDILAILEDGPSRARIIAERLGRSESRVHKCLRDLVAAGLVKSIWTYDGTTFKEYRLLR